MTVLSEDTGGMELSSISGVGEGLVIFGEVFSKEQGISSTTIRLEGVSVKSDVSTDEGLFKVLQTVFSELEDERERLNRSISDKPIKTGTLSSGTTKNLMDSVSKASEDKRDCHQIY